MLALGVAFWLGAAASRGRLGSLLVDTGRELQVARRLLLGEELYTDVRYYWGPLGPYLNAALFRWFGTSTDVLAAAGIATAAAMCCVLYLLSRQFLGPWRSASAVLPFVFLGAFRRLYADAIFNFVLPFNFSATYGIALATSSVTALVVHVRTGAGSAFLLSALTLALVALTKMELLFATLAAHGAFLLVSIPRLRVLHAVGYAASLAAVALVYGALLSHAGAALWSDNLGALLNAGSRPYVRYTMGLSTPYESMASIGLSLAALAVALGAAGWAAKRIVQAGAPRAWSALSGLAVLVATFTLHAILPLAAAFTALPLVCAVVLLGLLLRREAVLGAAAQGGRAHLVLWVFALALLARVLLRSNPMHYGFFLLPSALVALAVLVYDYAPRLTGGTAAHHAMFGAAGCGLLLGSLVGPISVSAAYFGDGDVVELATPTTRLLLPRGSPELAIVPVLRRYPPQTRVAAIPEGAGLVFASGLRSADRMSSYLPMELADPADELRVLTGWQRDPPDVIVWWRRSDQATFGHRGLGVDYGVRLARWVEAHYTPVTDPSEFMFVLERAR